MVHSRSKAFAAVASCLLSFGVTSAVYATAAVQPLWPQTCIGCFNNGPDGGNPNEAACRTCCDSDPACVNKDGCKACCSAYNNGEPTPVHCRRN